MAAEVMSFKQIPLADGYIFMYGIQRIIQTHQPIEIHGQSNPDRIPQYVGTKIYEVL